MSIPLCVTKLHLPLITPCSIILSRLFLSLFIVLTPSLAYPQDTAKQTNNFPTAQLLNEKGEAVNFYPDLVKNKLVAIHFVFTSCTMVCPMLGVNFAAAQRQLDALGVNDAHFISVSIDPLRDTPERLAQWRTKYGGKAHNWTLVTGEKQRIDGLLKKLEVFVADKQDHSSFVLIGNDATHVWKRVNGLSGGKIISKTLLQLRQTPDHP